MIAKADWLLSVLTSMAISSNAKLDNGIAAKYIGEKKEARLQVKNIYMFK